MPDEKTAKGEEYVSQAYIMLSKHWPAVVAAVMERAGLKTLTVSHKDFEKPSGNFGVHLHEDSIEFCLLSDEETMKRGVEVAMRGGTWGRFTPKKKDDGGKSDA